MKFKSLLIALFLFSSTLAAEEYTIDMTHTNVGFTVKHLMISTVRGNFTKYDGSFNIDPKTGKPIAINAKIDVASVNTSNEKRDDHLKGADFFDAKKHPNITFKMTSAKGDEIVGDLTIKGVTKQVKLEYEFGGATIDPWGNPKAAFTLEGKIKRSDFGITWNKSIEAGGVAVSDEVKLVIEVEGNGVKK